MKTGVMKQVIIKGYQSLVKVVLNLAAGLNVFNGETDSGKSSIIRAMTGFMHNAEGDGFVTVGAKKAVVEVDGVKWEKGKNVNRYSIGDKVFEKVGRGAVPVEVQQATGIREVEFGEGITRRLNITKQSEPKFFVVDKPSDNAKIIGSLSGIHIIFNALRDATADWQQTRRKVKETKGAIEELNVKAAGYYEYLPSVVGVMRQAAARLKAFGVDNKRYNKLGLLYNDVCAAKAVRIRAHEEVAQLRKLAGINMAQFDALKTKLERVCALTCKHSNASIVKARARQDIARYRRMCAVAPTLTVYDGTKAKLTWLVPLRDKLDAVITERCAVERSSRKARALTLINFDRYTAIKNRTATVLSLDVKLRVCRKEYETEKANADMFRAVLDEEATALASKLEQLELCPLTKAPMAYECKERLKAS